MIHSARSRAAGTVAFLLVAVAVGTAAALVPGPSFAPWAWRLVAWLVLLPPLWHFAARLHPERVMPRWLLLALFVGALAWLTPLGVGRSSVALVVVVIGFWSIAQRSGGEAPDHR